MRVVACLVLFSLVACAGNSVEERRSASMAGSGEAGGMGGASGGGMGGTAGNGATAAGSGGRPLPQRPCSHAETFCIDGDRCACRDDPRPECQSTRICEGDRWRLETGTCVEPPLPVACPESPDAAHDLPCTEEGVVCQYPGELSCVCIVPYDLEARPCRIHNGPSGPVVKLWYCGARVTGCPDGIPAIGSACSVEEASCGDPCANEYARVCRGGAWERWFPERECV